MDFYRVEVQGDACNHCQIFDEFDDALVYFIEQRRYDRKVSLVHVGEEYEEE